MKTLSRRALGKVALTLVGTACFAACKSGTQSSAHTGERRIISLSPSVTETLFAIGAGDDVVGVSDYCESPERVRALPRLGTSITPSYEAIAALHPTLIVSEHNASTKRRELEALAPTQLFPWLSLEDVATSTAALGALTGSAARANALAERLRTQLSMREPEHGPRVLLVLGGGSTPSPSLWFIRKNSLHGAALHAAGARNAVPEDVLGPPELSYERLLALDPDAILILTQPRVNAPKDPAAPLPDPGTSTRRAIERLTVLRAVREHKLEVLTLPEAFSNGPRIFVVVDALRASLARLGVR